jgi:hypothetical protein
LLKDNLQNEIQGEGENVEAPSGAELLDEGFGQLELRLLGEGAGGGSEQN